ncbi:MAG TPA: glucose-1-phosphate cytidylyltransferase [Gammaproteobacteria bacterium]|nr:glucose-1-phosphate cytidylyltransferase [Gammaproteobacteria bacterium]
MKVVLFCGGLGTRLREHSETIPKPLVSIGHRPIIWYLMKYYAYYGHKEFILCLGYKGNAIKEYFLNYKETDSNDFILSEGGEKIELLGKDFPDWKITFADTGQSSNIGQRLKAVQKYIGDDEYFLANYSDGLSDVNLEELVEHAKEKDSIASFVIVRPPHSFHSVKSTENGMVLEIKGVEEDDYWVNGGFFVLKNEIFDYIQDGEELVEEPFQRLVKKNKLYAKKFEGFWAAMDTLKDKKRLDSIYQSGVLPWMVWDKD